MDSLASKILEEIRRTGYHPKKIHEENLDPNVLWRNLVDEMMFEKGVEGEDESQIREQARDYENAAASYIAQMYEEDITSDQIMDGILAETPQDKRKFYMNNRKGAELGRLLDDLFKFV